MKENVWLTYKEKDLQEVEHLAGQYKGFLDCCKTERECTAYFRNEAEKAHN